MYQYIFQLITTLFLMVNSLQSNYLFTPTESLTVYSRPDSLSTIFSVINPTDTLFLEVKTIDNWFGFNPGVAQAANTGSFRYRWIKTEELISINPILPCIWGPQGNVLYAMTQDSTAVYPIANSSTNPIILIPPNSAAAITDSTELWFKVNLKNSPLNEEIQGWVQREVISIN